MRTIAIIVGAALLGQATYGPQTKFDVQHAGLDVAGKIETELYFEIRVMPEAGGPAVAAIRLERQPGGTDSKTKVLGDIVASLSGRYSLEVVAIDGAGNVSEPLRLPRVTFDAVPPRKPVSVRINGVVTLEPVQ